MDNTKFDNTKFYINLEKQYCAQNNYSAECVFSKALGIYVWDCNDKMYVDCLSGYAVVNQGHCHPKILEAAFTQMKRCTISSRAFYNDQLSVYSKKITSLFGYERVLPMSTGLEIVESAIKLCRKYGYVKKNIPECDSVIISFSGNFHGRSIAAISLSDNPTAYTGFGPLVQNMLCFPLNSIQLIEEYFNLNSTNISAIIIEPIQGESGINIPSVDFIVTLRRLCTEHDVLFIADEIQAGLGRTGKLLSYEWFLPFEQKPDIVLLGKALGGGVYPVSALLTSNDIMEVIKPGEHGSTFGGNPLACAVAIASLDVILDNKLVQNSLIKGNELLEKLKELTKNLSYVKEVRGKGLFIGIETQNINPHNLTNLLMTNGILTKATRNTTIRISPPLILTDDELVLIISIFEKTFNEFIPE